MNRTPKGCSNIGGSTAAKLEYCRNTAMELFSFYGYRPFSPAEFQLAESVWDNVSLARARRLIPLMSPFAESCFLRGDLTLSALAYLSTHFNSEERPLRLSYADRVFSVPESPKTNIEENQIGIELIGWESSGADVEITILLFKLLDSLSIKDSILVFGDAAVLSHIFKNLPGESGKRLVDALQEGSYIKYKQVLEDLELPKEKMQLLKALPSLKGDISVIDEAMKMMDDPSVLLPLKRLYETLIELGYEERLRVDLSFIRDLGYYSGPIFNAYSSKNGTLLGGGGRYDGLLTKLGIEGQAAGFALNLKDLATNCIDGSPSPSIMLWCGDSGHVAEGIKYADDLHKKRISFELSWNKDKSESIRIAKVRGYDWWVDCHSKEVIALKTEEKIKFTEFEGQVFSC